ncbi:MAG: hypothetical protein LAP85_28070 [Acidobacteriia bacterium]|nr:hypothetical protein [Terriglobia bacterium]
MNVIYQVTVHGRKLESRDLRKLLARAVAEKRIMDQRLRLSAALQTGGFPGSNAVGGSLGLRDAATR